VKVAKDYINSLNTFMMAQEELSSFEAANSEPPAKEDFVVHVQTF
jgi:hypothetical protein